MTNYVLVVHFNIIYDSKGALNDRFIIYKYTYTCICARDYFILILKFLINL